MRRSLRNGAISAIICVGLLGAEHSQAEPYTYGTPIATTVQAGVRQERWIDPININRLLTFIPSSVRAKAKQDFTSWNTRLNKLPRDFAEKYVRAKDKATQQQVSAAAYNEQKALAFDKLALFERYRIGRFFFAPGAKNLTARVKYLQETFQSMDSLQRASTSLPTFASMFPATMEYLAALGNSTSHLMKNIGGVNCAHAEEGCPPANSPVACEGGEHSCTPGTMEFMPYKPANGGAEILQGGVEMILLGCADEKKDPSSRGGIVLISTYAIAETHYVCADSSKNVSSSPVRALQAKVNIDVVYCRGNPNDPAARAVGLYLFDEQLEDGPIPDGCVGINKVMRKDATQELTDGSQVILNAAPCWEDHWECRYKADPIATVTELESIKVPDAPVCGG
jgi:hypothetical protein